MSLLIFLVIPLMSPPSYIDVKHLRIQNKMTKIDMMTNIGNVENNENA